MNKNLKLILAAAVATTFAASAHNTPNALVDSQGNAVKGDFGQCIESVYNDTHADCGAPAKKVEPPKVHSVGFTLGAHALFDFDKSFLRPEGKAQLNELAAKIKQGRELGKIKNVTGVEVVGHTDSKGTVAYNQGLSERRAASVRNYLVSQGIDASLISARGEGELNPVATNKTEAGRQENRRVDVTVQGTAAVKKAKK